MPTIWIYPPFSETGVSGKPFISAEWLCRRLRSLLTHCSALRRDARRLLALGGLNGLHLEMSFLRRI